MKTTAARWIAGWAIAILFVSSTAVAQVNENLRGTIQSVDGQTLVGETRDGMTINIRLTDGAHVFTLEPESILDVKVGSFVGIMTKQAVGTDRVVEIYIFPSDPAGDPFDIPTAGLATPGSATEVLNYTSGVISKNDGQGGLTVTRDGRDDTLAVSPDVNVVKVTPATIADIQLGRKFVVPNGHPVSSGLVAPTIILGE
jgi:hypothetical protein